MLQITRNHVSPYWPTMQIFETTGLPIAMVPSLHQNSNYIKQKFQGCRAQKYYPCVGAKGVQTSTLLQITRIHVSPYRADNANFRKFGASYRHSTVFAPKQYLHQKESLVMQSPKILSLGWCKKRTNFYFASNYPHSCIAILDRRCKFPKLRGFLSAWYRVCTKAIFISKGSFRDAVPKYIILGYVQIKYKPLRGFKLPAFMYHHIGPIMQISEISRLPFAMVPCLHQSNICIKRKL